MLTWLLPKNLTIYVIVALVVATTITSWLFVNEQSRHQRTIQAFAKFTAETKALGEMQAAQAAEEDARNAFKDQVIIESYENALQQLKDYHAQNPHIRYVDRPISMHNHTADSSCGTMPKASNSTQAAYAGSNGVEKDIATEYRQPILNFIKLEEEIVQCLELIKWNKLHEVD